MTTERWLPVVGYEGLYEVSDLGRIQSLPRTRLNKGSYSGKIMSPGWITNGRFQITLSNLHGIKKMHLLHRLVLQSFVGPCPDGMDCCHNDGNPGNNKVGNLRWDTKSENSRDVVRHGRSHTAKLTAEDVLRIREARLFGAKTKDLASVYGISQVNLARAATGRGWKHV